MVNVVKRVVFEVGRYTSDATGQQIELANAGRSKTKKPHFGFNLFCFGNRNEAFVRPAFTGDWENSGTGHAPNCRRKTRSRHGINSIDVRRTIMEPVMEDQCHTHGK
jgi:hypothetical protein